MDSTADMTPGLFSDSSTLMLAVLVFLAAAVLSFGLMAAVRVRGSVKRRTAGITSLPGHGELHEPQIRVRVGAGTV